MQTWAKRGLQTALVTGGLLMLGTGIASADEDVNPDKPASPLDGSVTVPVHIDDNALGTPLGQKDLPSVDKDVKVSVAGLVGAVPTADKVAPAVAPVVGQARGAAAPVAHKATRQASGALDGNRVDGDLAVPVDVSGNAVALLGNAAVNNDSSQTYDDSETVVTDGSGGFLAGNVVDLDWALPVQVTGNAVAGLGSATATGSASQNTTQATDVTSDGGDGVLSGNVIDGQSATPVQVTGNALAGGGSANSESSADTSATSGGYLLTSGADGAGSGNAAAVPLATPVELNGNALAGAGTSSTSSDSVADASAGAERRGRYNVPTYVETNGDPAVASGNVVETPVSGPALVCGDAAAAAGGADAGCVSDTTTDAGGTNRSTGAGSVASGAIVQPAVAVPAEAYGDAAAAVGGADVTASNTVDSTAGGSSYTRGQDSVASGTAVSALASGPADLFANSVVAGGSATATGGQDATATSGGHTGTTGDNSFAAGNLAVAPLAVPVEGMGNALAGAGGASASATETKVSTAGDGSNTDDDNGVASSNLITTPVAGAVQAFGNGAGAVGFTDAAALIDDKSTAGGMTNATGTGGVGAGNIGEVPISLPAQVFGTGVSGAAKGEQSADATSDITAGGVTTTDGSHGLLSGNVASGPIGSAGQVFGESAAALGQNDAEASSVTDSTAGGDTSTSGAGGLGTGNVVAPQALPLAQSFAAVASGVGGVNSSTADNVTDAGSGGDIDTAGDDGFLAGNLLDVPAGAVAQPFGDAVAAVASSSSAAGDNTTAGSAGGTSTTSGGGLGSLSGVDGTVPLGVDAPVYDVPAAVLVQAFTDSTNDSDIAIGEGTPQLALPVAGGMLPTELPSMTRSADARDLPLPGGLPDPLAGMFGGDLFGGVPAVGDVPDLAQLPELPAVPAVPALPGVGLPALPGLGDGAGQLPVLPAALPHIPVMPAALPQVPAGLGDLAPTGVTEIVPNVPALPTLDDVTDMSTVDKVLPDDSSLEATRKALANLLAVHPIG